MLNKDKHDIIESEIFEILKLKFVLRTFLSENNKQRIFLSLLSLPPNLSKVVIKVLFTIKELNVKYVNVAVYNTSGSRGTKNTAEISKIKNLQSKIITLAVEMKFMDIITHDGISLINDIEEKNEIEVITYKLPNSFNL